MRLTLGEIALELGVECGRDKSSLLTNVAIDSRGVRAGSLFGCIRGERVDGHDFIPQAVRNGAIAIIAERPVEAGGLPVLLVSDTIKALGQLAQLWRRRTEATVIGITGTAGKTTLKECLSGILAQTGKTAKTPLNHNNQLGLACAILNTAGDEKWWVMETGISRPGDMSELGRMLRPNLAIILNVGPGHTEGLGERGVAHYKAMLLEYLAPGGTALLSADYPQLTEACAHYDVNKKFFSATGIPGEYSSQAVPGRTGVYRLKLGDDSLEVQTPYIGAFGAESSVAAAAAAHILGVSSQSIQAGLAQADLPEQRFTSSSAGKWLVLDDSYNANPLSMSRMLEAARTVAGKGNLVLVLGEMKELGGAASRLHTSLGIAVADLQPSAVLWKGAYSEEMIHGLGQGGYAGRFQAVDDEDDFINVFRCTVESPGGTILFKGSRANHLEKFVEAFRQYAVREERS